MPEKNHAKRIIITSAFCLVFATAAVLVLPLTEEPAPVLYHKEYSGGIKSVPPVGGAVIIPAPPAGAARPWWSGELARGIGGAATGWVVKEMLDFVKRLLKRRKYDQL